MLRRLVVGANKKQKTKQNKTKTLLYNYIHHLLKVKVREIHGWKALGI